jgi:hypothetical protein
VLSTLTANGWTLTPRDEWNYDIARGNKTKSFWLGGAAGKDFYTPFLHAFSAEPSGKFIARLSRNAFGSAMRGGAIGATKTSNVFSETADTIGHAATQAGIFAAVRNIA